MVRFSPRPGDTAIRVVATCQELLATPFAEGCHAVCWSRTLPGDFAEVGRALAAGPGITPLDEALLEALPLSPAGRAAVAAMGDDLRHLREAGHQPVLECVRGAARDCPDAVQPVDVYSFHTDSSNAPCDTFLCSYTEPSSEGLRLDQARCCVDDPHVRARLLRQFGGADDAGFAAWLHEHCFDLHYLPLPGAVPFSFGIGNLWKLAVRYPGSRVPGFVHRAPPDLPGLPPRLLLIS